MPSISDARQKNAQRISAGGKTGTGVGPQPPESPLVAAPSPQLDLPLGGGLPQRGTYPAPLILGGDINDSNRMYRGAGMRSTTFPNPNTSSTIKNTTVVQAATESASAATLSILVNGAPTPVQDVLDLIAGSGMTITPDLIGGVTFSAEVGGTNEFDLTDNFHAALDSGALSGTAPIIGIGQLGWALFGDFGNQGGNMGGAFPNVGQFGWSNSATPSQAGWLTLAGSGSFSTGGYSQLGWGLADMPGAVATFIFKVETGNPLSSSPIFGVTQTSLYVGFTGPNTNLYAGGSVISRPDFFIGVRYDTSTTSPSINDSFFTLEVVSNPITSLDGYARNNTQGTTFVTSIAPEQGVWHTLTVDFTVAGSVTLTLDGTASLTTPVPTLTVTGTISTLAQNGAARLNWTVSGTAPQSFWNAGTLLTVSGFTAGLAAFNGVQSLTAADENFVGFNLPGVTTSGNGAATLTGYPSMIPLFMMGNDDNSSSPTLNNRMIVIDFFSLIWNPAN